MRREALWGIATAATLAASTARAEESRMVEIPGGTFQIGCQSGRWCSFGPARRVRLDAFRIDATEVTNAQYRACVAAGACEDPVRAPPDHYAEGKRGSFPVLGVSWKQAQAYCAWRKKRLPSEAEWERAARGPKEQIWPWGDGAKTCERAMDSSCTRRRPATCPVCSLPAGRSPEGLCDMVGNAGEWVSDVYAPISKAARRRVTRDPRGPCREGRRCARRPHVMKGLPLAAAPPSSPSARWPTKEAYYPILGFRCAAGGD